MEKKLGTLISVLMLTHPILVNALDMPIFFGDEEFPIDQNTLILDNNDTGGNIRLQFGNALNESLVWNNNAGIFNFSDDVGIDGNLNVTGTLATLPSPNSAPNNSSFANSQWSLWLDEINNEFELKARKSNGDFIAQTVGSGSGSATTGALPAVQARRTSNFTFASTNVYYDIDFNQTDIESDPTALEHDNSNTDNLLIKQSGLYLIYYQLTDYATSNHTLQVRVRANNNTDLVGSYFETHDYANEYVPTENVFMAQLNAGDFITLQARRTTSGNYLINETKMGAIKIEGIKGEDGADGLNGNPPAHEWSGTSIRFQNPNGTWGDWVNLGGNSYTPKMAEYTHSAGNQSINNSTLVAIYWNTEIREDSCFVHDHYSQSPRVYLTETGWYKVSYNISTQSQSNNTYSNINCYLRENGSTKIIPSDSYAYDYNRSGANDATNSASFLFQNTAANNYVEVVCSQGVTNTNVLTLGNQVWILLEKID